MSTLASVILRDIAANRPAASIAGRLFFDTTNNVMQRDNGSTWDNVAETASGSVAADTIWDAKGDLAGGTGANTAARLAVGSNGRVLVAASGETTGLKWAGGLYMSHRLVAVNDNLTATANVNSTTYISLRMLEFYHDWDFFPATHFHISGFLQANEAAQTCTLQLTQQASPTDPVSAAGDDLSVTNTQGIFSSGWIAVSDAVTGLTLMTTAIKGSNISVDFSSRWLDIAFKIA